MNPSSSSAVRPQLSRVRTHWPGAVILLLASWLLPYLVHLIPWAGPRPLGVYLLPAFWAVFVAVYFFGAWLGAVVAVVTPLTSLLVTGLPTLSSTGTMGVELVGYALFAAWFVKHRPAWVIVAPAAYLPAKALVIAVQWVWPAFHYTRNPFEHFFGAVSAGVSGLGVLLVINACLVLLARRSRSPGN